MYSACSLLFLSFSLFFRVLVLLSHSLENCVFDPNETIDRRKDGFFLSAFDQLFFLEETKRISMRARRRPVNSVCVVDRAFLSLLCFSSFNCFDNQHCFLPSCSLFCESTDLFKWFFLFSLEFFKRTHVLILTYVL